MIAEELSRAGTELAAVLERENRLLEALDLAAAAAELPAKQAATGSFLRAQKQAAGGDGHMPESMRELGARLRSLAAENRRLLERGLAAEGRVIAIIGQAARSHARQGAGYGATGSPAGGSRPPPIAISARA